METEEIQEMLSNHEARIKKIESMIAQKAQTGSKVEKKISIGEFLAEKKPSDDVQRTAVFAYFLDKYEEQENFNSGDILNCFVKSRSKKPANVNDKINHCIKNGWVSEHTQKKNDKKSFYLTQAGTIAVENDFKEEKQSK